MYISIYIYVSHVFTGFALVVVAVNNLHVLPLTKKHLSLVAEAWQNIWIHRWKPMKSCW